MVRFAVGSRDLVRCHVTAARCYGNRLVFAVDSACARVEHREKARAPATDEVHEGAGSNPDLTTIGVKIFSHGIIRRFSDIDLKSNTENAREKRLQFK